MDSQAPAWHSLFKHIDLSVQPTEAIANNRFIVFKIHL
jgi:hypothetical protein